MKRILILFIVLVVLLPAAVRVEEQGLLPSLTDAFGVPMPSLGDVLHRYPDSETKDADGGTVQRWTGITDEDFEAFSEYLAKVGASLKDYTVVDGVFTATIRKEGRTFTFVYQPAEETALVTYPRGTCDQRDYLAAAHYGRAKEYMANEQYDEAYAEFMKIADYAFYKDVGNLLNCYNNLIIAGRKAKYQVGKYVTFGSYPQTASGADSTPIEWLVLERNDQKVLLISRYGLDAQPYNTELSNVKWEQCTLRTWLNNTFLKKAFNADEQSAILLTNVDNSNEQRYDRWNADRENNTQDKIFLLSYAEVNRYFQTKVGINSYKALAAPTQYAIKQGAWVSENNTIGGSAVGWWWLRSPGSSKNYAADVNSNGSCSSQTKNRSNGSVRPALWLNLDDIF